MSTTRNRVSVKLQCPNPLFEKWLKEWLDVAKKKDSKNQHTYSLALQSLRKYPLPLEKGRDCIILKGFGNKLCGMLDERLKHYNEVGNVEYNSKAGNPKTKVPPVSEIPNSMSNLSKKKTAKKAPIDNTNEYIPTYKSGAYAILVALYKANITENQKSLSKKDLIIAAQAFSDSSFTKAEPGSYYTAWNSMRTLISKNFVKKQGNPAQYSLTDAGVLVGHKLYSKQNGNISSPTKLSTENEKANIEDNLEQIFLDKMFSQPSSDCDSQNSGYNDLLLGEHKRKLDFYIPEPIVPASSELIGICGIFTSAQIPIQGIVSNKVSTTNVTQQDILFPPYSFDIILYVDTQETNGGQVDISNDPILAELKHLNVNFEVKNLKVGDYCWICRDRKSALELVTPYIVERKRMDDLAASIKDGRFHEQKFRLKQCGLQNVIYMIESYGKKDEHVGLPLNNLYQATVNTLIQDGFCVKFVDGIRGVAEYLSCVTNLIMKSYENKTLVRCPKENVSNISITDDLVSLMFFAEFNKLSSKSKVYSAPSIMSSNYFYSITEFYCERYVH
ncbi:hypothetical protein WA026_004167 [Henosepilachna vigintioctopunctata]|uniref:Crossover junction endonuclease MUS81 n=1 Tax=Henosepilachna vigintioctopunctata TaxID=420089 RepID=A0AAW1UIS6_9CUCU